VLQFRIPFAGPEAAAGKLGKTPPGVMSAKAGIQRKCDMDSRLRGSDGGNELPSSVAERAQKTTVLQEDKPDG
jgi:hypothetical protein